MNEGGTDHIKAKAKDSHGVVSERSDQLSVSMPRNRLINNPWFIDFIEGFMDGFPLFARLLKL